MRHSSLLVVLGLCGLLGVAYATPGGLAPSPVETMREVLARPTGDERSREQVVAQLVRMGPNSIPELFGTYTGENVEALIGTEEFDLERWWCAPDEFGALSLEALGDMPPKKVVAYLKRVVPDAPIEIKLAGMRVLGELESAQGLTLLFQTASREGPKALRYRSVANTLEGALGQILAADKEAFVVLEANSKSLPPELLILTIEATRKADRPEGVRFLLSTLGQDDELDIAALEASGDLARRFPWRTEVDPRRPIRERLQDGNPQVRRAAAIAVGRLHDAGAFDQLVGMLDDVDPQVVRGVQWALRTMTGQTELESAEEWRRWYDLEDTWWRTEGARLRNELRADDPRRVTSAAQILARRTYHRDEVALDICAVIDQQVPAAVASLCSLLARLDSSSAVPTLVDLLFDSNARVRNSAGNALQEITGRSLPPEPWIWEKYANG